MNDATIGQLKSQRTKSEQIRDISGASVKEFVEQILFKEFKVFDSVVIKKKEEDNSDQIDSSIDNKKLDEVSGEGTAD